MFCLGLVNPVVNRSHGRHIQQSRYFKCTTYRRVLCSLLVCVLTYRITFLR
jgi:hypothetical protein